MSIKIREVTEAEHIDCQIVYFHLPTENPADHESSTATEGEVGKLLLVEKVLDIPTHCHCKSMDLADQLMHAGHNIHQLVRERLRSMNFKFCDDSIRGDEGEQASRDWFNEGRELQFRGIEASSTDHETQVDCEYCADGTHTSLAVIWLEEKP